MGSHQTVNGISDCLSRLSASEDTVEFMTQPGLRRFPSSGDSVGCGDPGGPDTFSCSSDREHESHLLCNDELVELLARTDWCLASFADLSWFLSCVCTDHFLTASIFQTYRCRRWQNKFLWFLTRNSTYLFWFITKLKLWLLFIVSAKKNQSTQSARVRLLG